jgi:hypothetical protein
VGLLPANSQDVDCPAGWTLPNRPCCTLAPELKRVCDRPGEPWIMSLVPLAKVRTSDFRKLACLCRHNCSFSTLPALQ